MAAMSRAGGRRWRRRIRSVLLLAFGLTGLLLGLVFPALDLGTGDSLASVLGLFVGLAGLALAVADFLRGAEQPAPDPAALAEDLARTVRGQWLEEAGARRLRDPRVLPLAWSATRREVADPAGVPGGPGGEAVPAGGLPGGETAGAGTSAAGSPVGASPDRRVPGARPAPATARVLRVRLDGRLDGRFEEATARLAAGYRQIEGGRLVVLGEPGAGKSVLAMLLTLGLLGEPDRGTGPDRPVPVLVPVSSWDPVVEALDDWLVRTLADAYYAGRPEIPRILLSHQLLLPVLDGLDEIPEAARRGAVRALNHALGRDRPVVVTCRSAEYEDVIEGGSTALRRAPVVEIAPVAAEDAVAYLSDAQWPEGVDWSEVYGELRTAPGGPVALALSTPLMVSVARSLYERSGGRPAELADRARFASRHAVEDHLVERFVDAAYADRPPAEAATARTRLTFLALYLHRHREQDLAWWLMPRRLFSAWAAPGVGLGLGALLWVFTGVLTARLTDYDFKGGQGAVLGGFVALLAMIVWFAAADRPPGRPAFVLRGAPDRLRRGFRTGLAFTVVPSVAVTASLALVLVSQGWDQNAAGLMVSVQSVALAVTAAVSCALAVHECLDAPPGRAARSDPLGSLREDRNSAMAGALAAGAVVALLAFPTLMVCGAAATAVGAAFNGWSHEPGPAELLAAQFRTGASLVGAGGGLADAPLLIAVCGVLPGLVTALLTLLTRAWTRFALLRLIGAVRGHLPWRLMDFLADAHRRGVLRQSGGLYRFRHVRLQEALVSGGRQPAVPPTTAGRRRRLRRALLAAGAMAAVPALLVPPATAYPPDSSRATLAAGGPPDSLWFEGGRLLTARGGAVQQWNAYTGRRITGAPRVRIRRIDLAVELFRRPVPRALRERFSADGSVEATDIQPGSTYVRAISELASGSADGVLHWRGGGHPLVLVSTCDRPPVLWDLTARRAVREFPRSAGSAGCLEQLLLSGDRTVLVEVALDETCRSSAWDVRTGRRTMWDGSCYGPPAVALSHDGRFAAGDGPEGIQVYDARTGAGLGRPLTGHRAELVALAFDRHAGLLAAAAEDGTVRIWDVPR
ncbi:hypothetical protein [Streptomyces sp. NBC_00239]|uniref:hypothetical protein n=1 Tax=Streptomyces sp. NBC_00239 TaxID=2903640 RepID=UPI002E2C1B27|nr:hypothetical protein [Streptomyces sp. NBC_00239]